MRKNDRKDGRGGGGVMVLARFGVRIMKVEYRQGKAEKTKYRSEKKNGDDIKVMTVYVRLEPTNDRHMYLKRC